MFAKQGLRLILFGIKFCTLRPAYADHSWIGFSENQVQTEMDYRETRLKRENDLEEDEMNAPVAVLLQPKMEVEEAEEQEVKTECSTVESAVLEQNDSEEEELKPLAAVYIKTEVETDEGTEEQDHYSLADCEDWKETKPLCALVLREQKEEGANAGISNERSVLSATKEVDDAEDASGSGSNRAGCPSEEREVSGIEEQPYSCSVCSKQFTHEFALVLHARRHSNIMNYECKECGKKFAENGRYAAHLRVHTRSRGQNQMSKCEVCGNSFRTTYINAHMLRHTGEKTYKCGFCEATFITSTQQLRHQETHLDKEGFQCKECGKSLSSYMGLERHVRSHTGEKPYKCGHCGKMFADSRYRRVHEARHSKEYPFNCTECGKGFSVKILLIKHMMGTHRGENLDWSESREQSSPDCDTLVMSRNVLM